MANTRYVRRNAKASPIPQATANYNRIFITLRDNKYYNRFDIKSEISLFGELYSEIIF